MNTVFNLKSFLKFLDRNKFYTFIDVFGFSISLTFVILIGVYTWQELSVDKEQPNADRIFILGNDENLQAAYGVGERLMDRYPEIESVMTFSNLLTTTGELELPVSSGDRKTIAEIYFGYKNFFEFFHFELVVGDKRNVLEQVNSAVISESFAHKLFRNENPVGQVIQLSESVNVIVTGIMKDIRGSVIPYSDILARMEKLTEMQPYINKDNFGNAMNSVVFLQTIPGTDLVPRAAEMTEFMKEFYWIYEEGACETAVLTPFKEAYFGNYSNFTILAKGDRQFVLLLLSVGVLILIFAITNYINLTVAQTGFRAKEVAIRELLGSSKKEAFLRLIIESTLLTGLSFLIALFLASQALPYANNLLQTRMELLSVISWQSVLFVLIFILLLGGVAGVLPAILITRTNTIEVVKGAFRQRTKMMFSKLFITFQNTITIGMLIASFVMILQIRHLITAPLGYQTDNIMDISLNVNNSNFLDSLIEELQRLSSVKKVAYSAGTPFNRGNNMIMTVNDNLISFQELKMDSDAFNMLGFEVICDNHLPVGEGIFLNEQAFIEMNLPKDTEAIQYDHRIRPIAGVIRDFQLYNITHQQDPVVIFLRKRGDFNPWNLLIEVQGDHRKAWNDVKETYERIVGFEFAGRFIDQRVQESFEEQQRMATIVSLFCFIAIVISLLGLLAMSIYFIQQRSREIAVRKVFGSANQQILWKLVIAFLSYVGIAFLIATPVMYWIMEEWLKDYSYRISLYPFIFVAAGLFCLVISFVTVFSQSYFAAARNPVESIKVE
ncbi:MAG: ABC transporter permease [Tannerellaceae bacterium]|nr:ABC transporter permease [Tannerellaceae bacterium]